VLATAVAQIAEEYDVASEAETYPELGQTEVVPEKRTIERIRMILRMINELWFILMEVKLMKKILVKSGEMIG